MHVFRHGHDSETVCIPGERPDALDTLRTDLAAEHRPATVTEELLVDEMAQHYWRMNRYRYLETTMWMADERGADGKLSANLELVQWTISSGIATHYQRCLAAAERAFYKALNTLRGIQKERGFVFSNSQDAPAEAVEASEPKTQAASSGSSGFVFTNESSVPVHPLAQDESGFVFSNPQTPASEDTANTKDACKLGSFLQVTTSDPAPALGFVFTNSPMSLAEGTAKAHGSIALGSFLQSGSDAQLAEPLPKIVK